MLGFLLLAAVALKNHQAMTTGWGLKHFLFFFLLLYRKVDYHFWEWALLWKQAASALKMGVKVFLHTMEPIILILVISVIAPKSFCRVHLPWLLAKIHLVAVALVSWLIFLELWRRVKVATATIAHQI
jgi:hypothetical protein